MRQSGRTTRMIKEAIQQAQNGRTVYVLAATKSEVNRLRELGGSEAEELGIRFETTYDLGTFNWEMMRARGSHPNCLFLVDHYAIESEFELMLQMLHRYDKAEDVELTSLLAKTQVLLQQSKGMGRQGAPVGESMSRPAQYLIDECDPAVQEYIRALEEAVQSAKEIRNQADCEIENPYCECPNPDKCSLVERHEAK